MLTHTALEIRVIEIQASNHLLLTPRLFSASFSIETTSSPTTPLQLKPFVHWDSRPLVKPSCFNGKLKVKPKGNCSLYTL